MVSLTEAPGVSNVRYWDAAATAWEDIQDTFICDTSGVIKKALNAHIGKSDQLIDFGCGGGRYLKFVSPRCRHVLGLDISAALLDLARKDVVENHKLQNVDLQVADLGANGSVKRLGLPACDVGLCMNVLLSPEATTISNIMAVMGASVRPGGKLVLLVPAVASALNISATHVKWVKERRRRGYVRDDDEEAAEASCPSDEHRGVFQRWGVRTQHYRLADIKRLLAECGFTRVLAAERVEYSWSTEFSAPSRWLDRDSSIQKPFDWLVIALRDLSAASLVGANVADAASIVPPGAPRHAWKLAGAAVAAGEACSSACVHSSSANARGHDHGAQGGSRSMPPPSALDEPSSTLASTLDESLTSPLNSQLESTEAPLPIPIHSSYSQLEAPIPAPAAAVAVPILSAERVEYSRSRRAPPVAPPARLALALVDRMGMNMLIERTAPKAPPIRLPKGGTFRTVAVVPPPRPASAAAAAAAAAAARVVPSPSLLLVATPHSNLPTPALPPRRQHRPAPAQPTPLALRWRP